MIRKIKQWYRQWRMDRDSYLMARISARRSKQFSDAMHGFAKAVERMMAKGIKD